MNVQINTEVSVGRLPEAAVSCIGCFYFYDSRRVFEESDLPCFTIRRLNCTPGLPNRGNHGIREVGTFNSE